MAEAGGVREAGRRPAGRSRPTWSKRPPRCAGSFEAIASAPAARSADLGDEEAPALLPGAKPPTASLLPYFIAVRNGDDQHLDVVADGNEQVIRARFADAAFFVGEDLQHKLEDFLPRLGTLTFQIKLGSMLDKIQAHRAPGGKADARCSGWMQPKTAHRPPRRPAVQGRPGDPHGDRDDLAAGHHGPLLCPAFRRDRRPWPQAIFEHYLPRFAGDELPTARAGLLVGLADRLDTLAGLFAAGLAPTGTKDPFAQRRAALGLVQSPDRLEPGL